MSTPQTQLPRNLPRTEPAKTIGLISDTHIPSKAASLPNSVFEAFQTVDYIIHAGDLVQLSVIEDLEQCAPVLAVQGNMDKPEVTQALPKFDVLSIGKWKIGVIHDLSKTKINELIVRNNLNVLVYGHTHNSRVKWENDVLLINPGSPTTPDLPFITKPTVALLKVTSETVTPEIIQI